MHVSTKWLLKSCKILKTEEVLCFKRWMISFCNSDKRCCHREADASMDAFDEKEIKNRRDSGSATCMLDLDFSVELYSCDSCCMWFELLENACCNRPLWPLKTAASEIGFLWADIRPITECQWLHRRCLDFFDRPLWTADMLSFSPHGHYTCTCAKLRTLWKVMA